MDKDQSPTTNTENTPSIDALPMTDSELDNSKKKDTVADAKPTDTDIECPHCGYINPPEKTLCDLCNERLDGVSEKTNYKMADLYSSGVAKPLDEDSQSAGHLFLSLPVRIISLAIVLIIVGCVLVFVYKGADNEEIKDWQTMEKSEFRQVNVTEYMEYYTKPEQHAKENIAISGEVYFVYQEGNNYCYNIVMSDNSTCTWLINYTPKEDNPKPREGDYVTFYGEFQGLTEVDLVLTDNETIQMLSVYSCQCDIS